MDRNYMDGNLSYIQDSEIMSIVCLFQIMKRNKKWETPLSNLYGFWLRTLFLTIRSANPAYSTFLKLFRCIVYISIVLIKFYLTTLSISQTIQHRMIGVLMTDDLEGMWPILRYYSTFSLEGLQTTCHFSRSLV